MVFCVLATLLITLAGPAGACPADYFDGLKGTRKDVLVVVNENSQDSCEVGRYYAERRGIAPAAIARVYAPTDFFIDWQAYAVLREQLLAHLLRMARAESPACAEDGKGRTPHYCETSLEQIRTGSGVNYLVTTLGVPSRVRMDYPGGDFLDPRGRKPVGMPTSVDNLLRVQLLNFHDYDTLKGLGVFGADGRYYPENRLRSFGTDGAGMREVNALLDRELAVGRIDALSPAAAKRLVDRALAAEQSGVAGRYLVDAEAGIAPGSGENLSPTGWMFGVFGEGRQACREAGAQAEVTCKAAALHGEWVDASAPVPHALLQGDIYGSQATATRFDNLLKYRRANCAEGKPLLCSQLAGAEAAACRGASQDVYQEIDTRCVGVAEGFVGTQQVSYPLSYLAVHPTGWGWGGAWIPAQQRLERFGEQFGLAFPRLVTGDGHGDAISLWYGPEANPAMRCFDAVSSVGRELPGACLRGAQRVSLAQLVTLQRVGDASTSAQRYQLSMWYHYRGQRALELDVQLQVLPMLRPSSGEVSPLNFRPDEGRIKLVPGGWQRVSLNFSVSTLGQAAWDGRYTHVGVAVSVAGLEAPLGLDDIVLQDAAGNALLRNGQFDQGHQQTDTGDYAANFLSRLNGTAFFGSVSHYQSGGRSFFSNEFAALGGMDHFQTAMRYFMRGLPLGDAVWLGERNLSGLLYGDPLYSPLAVRLEPLPAGTRGALALQGEVRNGSTGVKRWAVEFCPGPDPWVCMREGRWKPTGVAGTGAVVKEGALGRWTPPGPGLYSLRLRAECEVGGYRQTFSDFTRLRYGGY